MSNIFHHHVHDKDGYIEMEIFKDWGKPFVVHFSRYETYPTRLRATCKTFAEMLDYQVGMLIFAYSEEEFKKFEKAYEEWYKNHPRRKLIEEYMKSAENVKHIGNCSDKIETSALSDKPEIYADNEADKEVLRSCYYE